MDTSSPRLDFLILKNRKPIHRLILIFQDIQMQMCVDKARDRRQVAVISMTWGKGTDHLPISCQEGGKRGRSIGAQVEVWSAFQISATLL